MKSPHIAGLRFLQRDARHFQILFLGIFLVYGTWILRWDLEWERCLLLLTTCLVAQAFFVKWKGLPWNALKSAMITGLGLCLLLHAGHGYTLVLGALVAIGSKFLFRIKGKHIFNPANIGIVVAVLLTGDAWVSPGQWGSGPALVFLVGAAGLMVLLKVGRVDTSAVFLITFGSLDLLRTVGYLGWGMDVWAHRMMNGSLLLFTCFMITDPMTTPNAPKARVAWSILLALLTFGIGTFAFVHTAPIWALFVLCLTTPLLDLIYKGERFSWLPGADKLEQIPIHSLHPDRSVSPVPSAHWVDITHNQHSTTK